MSAAQAAAAATDSTPSANRPPVDKVRIGNITASIWSNPSERGDFHTVTFERSYKDGQEWKTSHNFAQGDLLELAKAADKAHDKIQALRQSKS